MSMKKSLLVVVTIAALALTACGKMQDLANKYSGQSADLAVSLKAKESEIRAAANNKQILVTVLKVAVQSGDASPVTVFENQTGHQFNLSTLKSDVSQVIDLKSIPEGTYDHAIVTLADTVQVTMDGVTKTVTLPESNRVVSVAIELVVAANVTPMIEINVKVEQFNALIDAIESAGTIPDAPIIDVEVHDHSHPSSAVAMIRLEGKITAIADDRTNITIKSEHSDLTKTVNIGADTVIVIPSQTPVVATVDQLAVDMEVDVKGQLDATSGAINAAFIRVEIEHSHEHSKLAHRHGVIKSVDVAAKTFVVTNTTGHRHNTLEPETTIDYSAAVLHGFVDANGQAVDVAADQMVQVLGAMNAQGVLVATHIILLHKSDLHDDDADDDASTDDDSSSDTTSPDVSDVVKLDATILSVGTDYTVRVQINHSRPAMSSAEVTVNLANADIAACGVDTKLTIADLKVGDRLEIMGKLNADTMAIDARFVALEHDVSHDDTTSTPVVGDIKRYGKVSNIDSTAKTFDLVLPAMQMIGTTGSNTAPVTIKVDYSNATLEKFVDASGVAIEIANDQNVEVVGTVNADGVLVAKVVERMIRLR